MAENRRPRHEVDRREAILRAMQSRLNRLPGVGEPSWVAVVAGECLLGLDQHGYVVIPDEPNHYVTFDDERGWFIEHSVACRLAETIGTCEYNDAIREIAEDFDPIEDPDQLGRWKITEIDSEGLPSLEGAPRKKDAPGTAIPESSFAVPDRIAIDAKGYGWRVWDNQEMWSMVPVNPDNSPIPQPVKWFVPATDKANAMAGAGVIRNSGVASVGFVWECGLCSDGGNAHFSDGAHANLLNHIAREHIVFVQGLGESDSEPYDNEANQAALRADKDGTV